MKFQLTTSLSVLGLLAVADAFPSVARHVLERDAKAATEAPVKRQIPATTFDAESQYISTDGVYAFVPPGKTDQRGPCPGLNAMANHGYLPHNGVATIEQFIQSCNYVFGMGLDLAGFLAVYGAIIDGNGLEWSIGGPTPLVAGPLADISEPEGISGSHNKYESDASPTRGDLYTAGNDYTVQVDQFKQLYELGQANGDSYDLPLLTKFRATRFQQSIETNPEFFYGPFSGVIVSPAAYTFIYRFMANKSAEYPEGRLDGEVLKSFFSITGDYPDFTYTEGYERIPDNWYTRNSATPYSIPYFATDAIAAAVEYPQLGVPGGNTGTTNSFTGINVDDVSGGVFSLGNLAEGDNAFCFGYQLGEQLIPDAIRGLVTDLQEGLTELTGAFSKAFGAFNCPQIENTEMAQFNIYPGFTATYGQVSK